MDPMYIEKRMDEWNDMITVISGYVDNNGYVIPHDQTKFAIRATIQELGEVFDQFLEMGNIDVEKVDVRFGEDVYTFGYEMARELFMCVSVAWNEYEASLMETDTEEWTDEQILFS